LRVDTTRVMVPNTFAMIKAPVIKRKQAVFAYALVSGLVSLPRRIRMDE